MHLFGTDGIRTTVGTSPFTMNELIRLGSALGLWIEKKYGPHAQILIAHDTRASASFVKAALKTGILLYQVHIYDAGILPTPAVCQLLTHHQDIVCGIVISASHNPYQDNGIKIFDGSSGKLTTLDAQLISRFFHEQHNQVISYHSFGTDIFWPFAREQYITNILAHFPAQLLTGIKIVIDCAHGATSTIAGEIFEKLDADIVVLNNNPNGVNINHACGSEHPAHIQQAVLDHQAHIGFAFDGDGDRLVAVNRYGNLKNGDDILALLVTHPRYEQEQGIVGTIMTNQGLALFLHEHRKILLRTPVGDHHVTEQLKKDNLLLGGEQSGHIIMRDYLPTADGIFAALRLLEAVIIHNNWELTTFMRCPQILINVPVTIKKKLTENPCAQIIADHEALLSHGRLIVRYSGTQNLLRVMVEAQDSQVAQTVGTQLAQALQKALEI
jgi:phosphoglucosamine mutase